MLHPGMVRSDDSSLSFAQPKGGAGKEIDWAAWSGELAQACKSAESLLKRAASPAATPRKSAAAACPERPVRKCRGGARFTLRARQKKGPTEALLKSVVSDQCPHPPPARARAQVKKPRTLSEPATSARSSSASTAMGHAAVMARFQTKRYVKNTKTREVRALRAALFFRPPMGLAAC